MHGTLEQAQAPDRHVDKNKPQAPVFVVEGEIAAGKTELVLALAGALRKKGLKVGVAVEPVDLWKEIGILQKFYENPARYAYGFQTFVYVTRILRIKACVEETPDADLYLLERSPATDMVFMEIQRGDADPVEMGMYKTWCATYAQLLPFDLASAKVLYLKTSLDVCMRRLAGRERPEEICGPAEPAPLGVATESASGGVSIGYQAKLRRAHEAFLQGLNREEFPLMEPSPFRPENVIEVGPSVADCDFRLSCGAGVPAVTTILGYMGY
jgi:deoxyadenosine/deoxycytidine kinase